MLLINRLANYARSLDMYAGVIYDDNRGAGIYISIKQDNRIMLNYAGKIKELCDSLDDATFKVMRHSILISIV